jgi:hypothetical protein
VIAAHRRSVGDRGRRRPPPPRRANIVRSDGPSIDGASPPIFPSSSIRSDEQPQPTFKFGVKPRGRDDEASLIGWVAVFDRASLIEF